MRIALFTDCFHEANGVGTLSREFAEFARRRELPLLYARVGDRTQVVHEGSTTVLELKRGFATFPVDHGVYCDPLLTRYKNWAVAQLREFAPDLIHITGPGDIGILGAWAAHELHVPRVASWHTNLHEYASRRLDKLFGFLPNGWRAAICRTAEEQSLRACVKYYRMARFTLAPNQAMVDLLAVRTGKPSFLMAHGVDVETYNPSRRHREDGRFRIGYVGRLTPEKNVRLFAELEKQLIAAGCRDFEIVMVGDGDEKAWLREHVATFVTLGILRGAALAEAFANMDVFVFPSETDTFGLVLLEAMASGVPVVLSPQTAVQVGVTHGVNGFAASGTAEFTQSVLQLMRDDAARQRMSVAARAFAMGHQWCCVFEDLCKTYELGLAALRESPKVL